MQTETSPRHRLYRTMRRTLRTAILAGFVLVAGLAPAVAADDLVELTFEGCTPAQREDITEAVALAAIAVDDTLAPPMPPSIAGSAGPWRPTT
jgi:hypothetical protein